MTQRETPGKGEHTVRSIFRATALAGILRGVSKGAQRTLRDPRKMQKLANDASRHAAAARSKGGIVAATLAPVLLMGRLLRAYARREYRAVPWATMGAISAALAYFVMPFDFVPDILAGFGLVDDLALVAFVMQKTAKDLQEFSAWEVAQRGGGVTVDGHAEVVQPKADSGVVDDVYIADGAEPENAPNAADSKEAMDAILAAVLRDKKARSD